MVEGLVGKAVGGVGDYLREQRIAAALSLRELAEQSGVSNPYLSMVERGVRNPSAQVLQQVAKALQISAEQLYVRAGLLSAAEGSAEELAEDLVEFAIRNNQRLSDTQKDALLATYASYIGGPSAAEQQSGAGA